MWPKLLLDLLPHFSRLVPVADKYFSGRSAADKAQAAMLTGLAADVRGELDKVTEAHAGLGRQVQEQGAQVAELAVDVARARMGVESVEGRVAGLEKRAAMTLRLMWVALGLLVVVMALLTVVVVHGRR